MGNLEELEQMEKEDLKSLGKTAEKKSKEDRIYYKADLDGVCDLVMDGKDVKYLMEDGEIIDEIRSEDKVFSPPFKEDLDYLLPKVGDVIEEASKHHLDTVTTDTADVLQPSPLGCAYCKQLYKELYLYHNKISELPSELYLDLLVFFDFHNYLIEKFNFSPILYFFADKERGKTRTAKGLIYLARRGVMTETLREANLIRWGRDHKATLLFDVKNFAKKLDLSQSEDLVYGRAERGVVASRVLFPEKGAFRDTVRFEVFGATIVTSNRMLDDVGLSRTIIIEMKPSEKIFKFEPTKENALKLKTKLSGMRLAHLKDKFIELDKEETGRIEDMLIGYRCMIKTLFPEKMDVYYKIKSLIKGQKTENALDSFEAQIMQIVLSQGNAVEEGSLTLTFDHICSLYNEGKPEKWHLSPQSLSKTLRGMGFTSKRNSDGDKRGIFYDIQLINRLKKIYGLEDIEGDGCTPSGVSDESELIKEAEAIFDT
jgi:hypothetical protein